MAENRTLTDINRHYFGVDGRLSAVNAGGLRLKTAREFLHLRWLGGTVLDVQIDRSEDYHPFRNHYTHEITIFELFRGLQLQYSGVFRINQHYSYSFLFVLAECGYRK